MKPRMPLLALAASTLLLVGCAAAPSGPPPGLDDAGLAALSQAASDARWTALRLPSTIDEPAVSVVAYTSGDTWSITQVQCLTNAGLAAREVSGGFTVDGYRIGSPQSNNPFAVSIAIWTCQAQFPRDVRLSGYITDDQVLYMYDFFTKRLAPCLALHGYDIPPAPARDGYLETVRRGIYWNPYYTATGHPIVSAQEQFDALDLQCPGPPNDSYWAYLPFAYLHSLNQEGTGGLR